MGKFFNNGSMTMEFHILDVLFDLESHARNILAVRAKLVKNKNNVYSPPNIYLSVG